MEIGFFYQRSVSKGEAKKKNKILLRIQFPICTGLGCHLNVVSTVQRLCSDLSMEFLCFQIERHQVERGTKRCIVSGMKGREWKNEKSVDLVFMNCF